MSASTDRARRLVAPAIAASAPLALLAASPGPDTAVALAIVGVGAAGSIGLRMLGRSVLRPIEGVPFLAALLAATVLVAASPGTELLAGLAGLGVLLWVAQDPAWPMPFSRTARGLALPALALGLAFGVALALPVARQSVGIAAALVVVSLGALGWALTRPTRLVGPSPS